MKRLFKYITIGILLLGICAPAFALEIIRQKNAATYVVFPIMKNDGTLISSATGLDSEIDVFADGTAPDGFADCTNEATEIGSTGQYYLSLTQSEMNNQYVIIQIKSTSTDAVTQTLLIHTTIGDPDNLATTDDGGTINVTSGKIDEVSTLTGHTAQTGDAYAIVNSGTYGNSAIEGLVDDLETRLTATRAGYLDKLNVSGTLAHSDAAATYKADVSGLATSAAISDMAGATFNTSTDSLEALRDRGDAAWATATGFSTHSAADVVTAMQAVAGDFKANVSNLDVAVSTRLATAGYTAPDNAGITNIYNIVNSGTYGNSALNTAIGTRLASASYTAPDNTTIGNIAGILYNGSGYATCPANKSIWDYLPNLDEAISGIDDDPWDAAVRTLTSGDNIALAKGTGVTGFNDIAATDVWAAGTRTLTAGAYSGLTGDDISGIWNKDISGYTTAGYAGTYLKGAGAAGDPWSTDLSSGYTGQAGEMLRKVFKRNY
jgi:hypothetical protein